MKTPKIYITLLLFTLLIASLGYTQEKINVGISMGSTSPIGNFGSIEFPNANSGFAESGVNLNFDGNYKLHNRISLTARLNFGMAAMNKSKVQDWLESDMFDYLNEDENKNLYSIDYWQWTSPMVGAKYNYPIVINKLYFETGVFSGISIVQTPNQNLTIIDEASKKEIYSENIQPKTISVPFMAEAGLRYKLNDDMQIEIKSSYFQSKANYEHVKYDAYVESGAMGQEYGRTQMEVPLQTVNISVGIIYTIK